MAHRFTDRQKALEYLGFGCSILAGLLIGLGQFQALLWGPIVFLTLIAVLLGLRTLVDSPGILGFWLLSAAILIVTWNAVRAAPSVTAADLFLLLSAPFALYGAIARSKRFRIPWWLVAGVALIGVSLLLQELLPKADVVSQISQRRTVFQFQEVSASSLVLGARLVLALAIFPLVAVHLVTSWSQVRMLVNLWIIGVTLSGTVAILDAFAGTGLQEYLSSNTDLAAGAFESQQYGELGTNIRYVGLTVHPITLSLTAALIMPVILARMTTQRKVLLYIPFMLISIAGILLSGSRTGVVVLLGIAIAYFVWRPKARWPIIAGAASIAVLLIATSSLGYDVLSERISSPVAGGAELSNTVRIEYLREGISNIARRPLTGYGFELSRQAHNIFLQMWLSGGIFALVGFLMVTFGYVQQGLRLGRLVPEWLRGDVEGLTLAFLGFLFAGLFGNYIFDRFLFVPVAILMATAGLVASQKDEDRSTNGANDAKFTR